MADETSSTLLPELAPLCEDVPVDRPYGLFGPDGKIMARVLYSWVEPGGMEARVYAPFRQIPSDLPLVHHENLGEVIQLLVDEGRMSGISDLERRAEHLYQVSDYRSGAGWMVSFGDEAYPEGVVLVYPAGIPRSQFFRRLPHLFQVRAPAFQLDVSHAPLLCRGQDLPRGG